MSVFGGRVDVAYPVGGGAGAVSSVFGRTGAVVAASNDYTWAQINKAVSSLADITTRSHTLLADIGSNTHAQIDTHIADASDPHGATLTQTNLNITGTFDISNTAPELTLTDTSVGVESLRIRVDGSKAYLQRVSGSNGSLLTINLSADTFGIGTDSPTISGTGKLDMNADTFRLRTARTPASATAAGNAGEVCWDANYVYVCTATNTWVRAALVTWS